MHSKIEFKVGDRVRVYGSHDCSESRVYTVCLVDAHGMAVRLSDIATPRAVHPKQCRRLKPKQKLPKPDVVIETFGIELDYGRPALFLTSEEFEALSKFDCTAGVLTYSVRK